MTDKERSTASAADDEQSGADDDLSIAGDDPLASTAELGSDSAYDAASDPFATPAIGGGQEQASGEERLQSAASDLAGQARQLAETRANDGVTAAASQLHRVAEVVRDSGSGLREEQPGIAGLADQAASQVDRAASYLEQHDVRDLMSEAERFARREPMLVLAGGFAVGLVAARVLRMAAGAGQPGTGGLRGRLGESRSGDLGGSLGYQEGGAYVGSGSRI